MPRIQSPLGKEGSQKAERKLGLEQSWDKVERRKRMCGGMDKAAGAQAGAEGGHSRTLQSSQELRADAELSVPTACFGECPGDASPGEFAC